MPFSYAPGRRSAVELLLDALHLAADRLGAEVADAPLVGVVHLARGAVLAALHGLPDAPVGLAEGDARERQAVDILDRKSVV